MQKLFYQTFSAWDFFAEVEATMGKTGAINTFIGHMRDFRDDHQVSAMEIVHYPGMCEKELAALTQETQDRFNLQGVAIAHRIGKVFPGDTLVAVITLAHHRAESFAACHFLMEALKHQVPLWKKEWQADGQSAWVDKNSPGYLL